VEDSYDRGQLVLQAEHVAQPAEQTRQLDEGLDEIG
jgi:hypothetical protein